MGILLVNGDSFTYGDELKGSRSPDGIDTHHHHTWVYKLSTKLKLKYHNLARNGSSNMKIYRTTLDFLMRTRKEIDFVIIIWSNFSRNEFCKPHIPEHDKQAVVDFETNMHQWLASNKTGRFYVNDDPEHIEFNTQYDPEFPENQRLLKIYFEEVTTLQTNIIHTLFYMTHIQWMCDKLNIPVMQGVIHPDIYKNCMFTLKKSGWEEYKERVIEYLGLLRPENKIGFGGVYPSIYELGSTKYTVRPGGHVDEDAHTEYADILYDIIKEKGLLNNVGD